ncbi:MAG TPA: MFS transporter [Nevskiaceae bacterium]|nr:MFS transporter [Nevskiaceae bacterium]
MTSRSIPAKRLAGFYFWYFAAIGALIPYLGLYLQARGLSAEQIGIVLGLLAVTRIFAPYVWGTLADRSGRRMSVIRWTLTGATLCWGAVGLPGGFVWLLGCLIAYGALVNGTMAQFEVVTFSHLDRASHRYARLRVWGSVGFVVVVLGLGPVLEQLGILSLPAWIAAMFVFALVIAQRVPEPIGGPRHLAGDGGLLATVRQRPVIALLVACLLAQFSYGPYYGFFSIYLESHGYRKDAIGLLWSLGVIAEVAMFWFIASVLPQLPLRRLLLWSLAATVARWLLQVAAIDHPGALAAVQLIHAISFGVYHLAAVNLVQQMFPPALQGRGQAIYVGVSYGIGGALGGWLSGYLWDRIPVEWIWIGGSAAAALAWLIAWRGLRASPSPVLVVAEVQAQ